MSSARTIRVRLWPVIAIAVLVLAGLVASFAVHTEELVDVHTATPAYRDLAATLSTNGRVTPINGFQARAAVAAQVEKIYVHVGEKVKPGQMLVKLNDPFAESRYTGAIAGLDSAEAAEANMRQGGTPEERINFSSDLKHAQAEQAAASSRLQLLTQLQQRGDASAAEVADAQRRLTDANTTLQAIQQRMNDRFSQKDLATSAARLTDARAIVQTAREVLANADIRSSIAGTVYSVPISPYDFVPMGANLVLIADLNAVQIHAFFDEPEIGQLRKGEPVDVYWDAKPGVSWRGRVEQPPLTVAPQGARNVGECLITVDNSAGELLPNTNVTVRVTTATREHVLSIPREALHTDNNTHFVFRLVNGRAVRTPVQTGIINLAYAEITSGLSPRDQVIVDTANGLQPTAGMAVRRIQ